MPRKHYARALISNQDVAFDNWMEVLRAQNEGAVPKDHVHRIAKTVLKKCDPKQYLLSHATIVASVDTMKPKGAKTGTRMNRGVQIDVKFPDYAIKPDCVDIINNNGDAWERSLLLSTYRTFIGAQNYLEHIQLPELSKGFIVDAVARDLGNSCYIDILVATDRKHKQLVSDIITGDISALSMGCISLFTICTKCGNVAADESQLCPCIQYEGKHTEFTTDDGKKQKIAELIGHVSVPNSNQFIEASWVRSPAFAGAVRRNFLNADMLQVASKMMNAIELQSNSTVIDGAIKKAASRRVAQEDDQSLESLLDSPVESDETESAPEEAETPDTSADEAGDTSDKSEDKIDALLNKIQEQLLTVMVEKLGEKLAPKPEDVGTALTAPPIDLNADNDSMIRGASAKFSKSLRLAFPNTPKLINWAEKTHRIVHEGGVKAIKQAGLTPKDLIVLSWIEDRVNGKNYSPDLYKLAMNVGPMSHFNSEKAYLNKCQSLSARTLTDKELRFLSWKGKIASIVTI